MISELVLRYSFYLYWNLHLKAKSSMNKKFDWHTEFELADEFVWIQVVNCELWISIVVYPAMAWLSTIFIYLHTRYLIYRLQHQKRQPLSASNDMGTGSLMNMYSTITFLVVFAFYSCILFLKTPRFKYWSLTTNTIDLTMNCGPFESNNEFSPTEEVGLFP